MPEENNKRRGRPTGTVKIFEKDFKLINEAYSNIRIQFIKYFETWNKKNPNLEQLKANDLFIMAYFHFCIPEKLNPPDLGVNQTKVQDRLKEILYPYLKSANELTEEAYVGTISDEKNNSIFLQRLVATRCDIPEVIPYMIPGAEPSLRNLFDVGYITPATKLKLRILKQDYEVMVTSDGCLQFEISGKSRIFGSLADIGSIGFEYKGFNPWKFMSVIEPDGSLPLLDKYREKFEKERPIPAHFDSRKSGMPSLTVMKQKDTALESDFYEGSITRISIERRERDQAARQACIALHKCRCGICCFDFGQFYGPPAAGFIHVHHLSPLSNMTKETKVDPEKDLIPLCPNCHSVVHLQKEPYSIDEVRIMIEIAKKQKEP
jgi:HNH endonuclease